MSNLTEEELAEMIYKEVHHDRERCALLCEDLAGRWALSAKKMRADGSFKTWGIRGWRIVSVDCVAPKWEKAARDIETAAHGLITVARGIRAGWDTRKFAGEPVDVARSAALDDMLKNMRC